MDKKIAIIAGATGLVGGALLDLLLADETYSEVKVLTRRSPDKNHEKLTTIKVNFDALSNYAEEMKADVAFCCLGTTLKKAGSKEAFRKVDFTYPLAFAKIMQQQGTQDFFLITAMGASASSFIFYNKVKGEIEDAVKEIPFHAVHVMRPSLLLGDRSEKRTGEDLGKKLSKFLNPIIPDKYKGIKANTVAKAMQQLSHRKLEGFFIYPSDVIRRMV